MWFKNYVTALMCLITVLLSGSIEAGVATKLTLNPSSGLTGGCSSVHFIGRLTRVDTGVGVANAKIELYLNNAKIAETNTNQFGNYSLSSPYVEQLTKGQHNTSVKFRETAHFRSSAASNVHTNGLGTPTLRVRNRTVRVTTVVLLQVDMSNCGKLPVAGKQVKFFYNGGYIGESTTNGAGIATKAIRVTTPGINTVRVEFAEDNFYRKSAAVGWINGT